MEHLTNVDHLFDHLSTRVQGDPRGSNDWRKSANRLSTGIHGSSWESIITYMS
jgi:hypothetical protein